MQYVVVGIAMLLGQVRVKGPFPDEASAFAWANANALIGFAYHVCPLEKI